MSHEARMECVESIYLRYKRASRKEKTLILNEFCATCGYHRKHAIRLLKNFKRFTKPKSKKRGAPSIYDKPAITEPLKRIWLAANLPCSKRLKAIISLWMPGYAKEYGALPLDVIKLLYRISPPTIDRILKPLRAKYRLRGRCTTKPGTLLRKQIPIKTDQWNESRPGFVESDTVAHCGNSTEGDYVNTVDLVDIATGWTEQGACWGKGEAGVLAALKDIEERIPFPILGFDADNGGEFINHHLWHHFADRMKPVQFTRSRPYHKDDNAHVEQKNWTHVRQWFGYYRLDKRRIVDMMNELYQSEWRLYHNFFQPSTKLIEKKVVASKTLKRYDKPKTPYERVLESKHVEPSVKRVLKEQFKTLNPFQLKKGIETKMKKIFDYLNQ
ncbi:MAG: integrase [Candidatus Omnitrophota bacterium]